MSNKVVYAIYNDDDILMDAVKQTRAAHHHIEEVLSISVHGLINGPCAYQTSYLFVHIRLYWYFICYVDDELHYDSGSTGYWWKPLVILKICQHLCLLCLR
jgi:hypothetical protein